MSNRRTIAVAMSGGVDSSAVAGMLHRDGHPVIGLTMQLGRFRRRRERGSEPRAQQAFPCVLQKVY